MVSSVENKEMDFLDHLEELRWRIIKALLALVVCAVVAFIFSDRIMGWLILPAKRVKVPITIQVLKIQGLFMLKFSIAFWGGLILSIPFIIYQVWAFIAPGLYKEERRWGAGLIIGVGLAFLLGVLFAYFVLIPIAVSFLVGLGSPDIARNISIEFYIKFILQLLLASGIVFQMPIAAFLLTKLGIITPQFLIKYWRHAIVIIAIVAAIITPPDPGSMIIMLIPLTLLYWVSILFSKLAQRSRTSEKIQELAG